jgi:L-alanine-DL-glutamate epimerase-like enolase superfamily enzyme
VKIVSVDPFYLRMPEVALTADGTQDSFLVRVRADNGLEGWGESDASPLVSLAAYCCPPSHSNIINIRESLLGQKLETPDDIRRLHAQAQRNALDLLQFPHAYSAADLGLWDLLGKHLGEPVFRLLDGPGAQAHPKRPYASVLFGESPEATLSRAQALRGAGFTAAKFGWGPMGKLGRETDVALVRAAREGLGKEAALLVDAGVAWGEDDQVAFERASDFAPFEPVWLEEPLFPDAIAAYRRLTARRPAVPIAAGEGSARYRDAEDLLQNGGVQFIQIDVGRIGGLTTAHRVRKLAEASGATYVNHTYKSSLSVAASLQVFASVERFGWLEYPAAASALAQALTPEPLLRDPDGLVRVPERPGLGLGVNPAVFGRYLHSVRIEVGARTVFRQPSP